MTIKALCRKSAIKSELPVNDEEFGNTLIQQLAEDQLSFQSGK